jgi:hypothetical protein
LILKDFIQKALIGIGEYAMSKAQKAFSCDRCGNDEEFIWKTRGFKKFLLVTDGDTSILEDLKGKVEIIFQRCLWHIPHQLKVERKTKDWLYTLAEVLEICAIRPLVDCEETLKAMVASKQKRLQKLIKHCRAKGYEHTITYLYTEFLTLLV